MADHLILERRRKGLEVDEWVGSNVAHCVLRKVGDADGVAFGVRAAEELGWDLAEVGDLGLDGLSLNR